MTYKETIEVTIKLQQGQNWNETLWLAEDAGLEQCEVNYAMQMIIGYIACVDTTRGYSIFDKLCGLPGVQGVDSAVIQLTSQEY